MADDGSLDDGGGTGATGEAGRWLLAIECATRTASVALLQGDALVGQQACDGRGNHAETLLGMLDVVLAEAGVSLCDVGRFAVSIGPGSFTSLRVGLATVKGLAFASDARVAPVSTLAALAWEAGGQAGADVASALDARRGEVYGAVFRCGLGEAGASVEALCSEGLFSPEAFAQALPERCLAAGSGVELYAGTLGARAGGAVDLRPGIAPSARAVGALGAAMLVRGEGLLAEELAPRYLRRAEAEALRLGSELEAPG